MRKKIKYILVILVCFVLITLLIYHLKNLTIYKLEWEIKGEYDNVKRITVADNGPDCYIFVYMKEGTYGFEDIEPIFIRIMLELDKENVFNYFNERHCNRATGELAFLNICFYNKNGKGENLMFDFNSHKNFEKWELRGHSDVIYNVSDYK